MKKLTQHEYDAQLQEIRERNEMRERRKTLREERHKMWPKPKMPAWSKLMMIVVYLICLEIICFAEWLMFTTGDTSALYSLISVPAAMFGVFWAYAEKSKTENSASGIVYETTMLELQSQMAQGNENLEVDPEPLEATDVDDSDAVG